MDEETGLLITPQGEGDFSLNADNAVRFGSLERVPDEFTAYAVARFGFAWPNINAYGEAAHPAVLAASFPGVVDRPVNLDHEMKYHGRNQDKVVGCVLAAEFPRPGGGTWEVGDSREKAASGRAFMALFKHAAGMDRVLGRHLSARHHHVVSQEFKYDRAHSGFLIRAKDGDEREETTPEQFWRFGWNYVPVSAADDELMATRDFKRRRMKVQQPDGTYAGDYKGRTVHWLMNGHDAKHPLRYTGVAVVPYGAEGMADLETLLASRAELEIDHPEIREGVAAVVASLKKIPLRLK